MIQAIAPPDLPRCWTGRIHSLFANSCNVALDGGGLLTIHRFSFGMLPRSLYEPELFTGDLEPGAPVQGGPEGVRLGEALLKWGRSVRVVDTRIHAAVVPPGNWKTALALLRERQDMLGGDAITQTLYSRLRQALAALWEGLLADDQTQIVQQCRACVGLGLGLTPSGDDMLLGSLTALHMYRPELARRLGEGIRPLLGRTNDISRSYLELALDGYAATPVLGAAAELAEGGTEQTEMLLHVGHSSGCDILEGLITTAERLEQIEEGRMYHYEKIFR